MSATEEISNGLATLWPEDSNQQPTSVLVVNAKKRNYEVHWLNLWQDVETGVTLVEQAKMDTPLTQTEYRVRDMLLGSIGLGNWAIVNQSEIARQIRVHRSDVSKAILKLIELGIVIRGDKIGRNSQYMINPAFCFKGRIEEGQKYVKKAAKLRKEGKAKVIPFPAVEPEQGSLF